MRKIVSGVKNMKIRRLFTGFLVLVLIVLVSSNSIRAQTDQIQAEIHPTQGTANTQILIRFLTMNATIGNVETADFFWDEVSIGLNVQGNKSADGSYNYFLNVPSQPPLSDIGNHTIRADSSVLNYGQISFSFTFEIIEFVPSPEYIALNETYYSLLANYTALNDNYNVLLQNYSSLLADHNALLTEHADLLSNYNSLSANYNSLIANFNALSANYNSLLSNYNSLNSVYGSFLANYTSLQASYVSLNSNYDNLNSDYDNLTANYALLETNYQNLRANYDSFVNELAITRNLNYAFITSTIVLAVAVLYLVLFRRPRIVSKTR